MLPIVLLFEYQYVMRNIFILKISFESFVKTYSKVYSCCKSCWNPPWQYFCVNIGIEEEGNLREYAGTTSN